MLALGMASSHAPTMFLPVENWPEEYEILVKDVPQPRAAEQETPEANVAYKRRIDAGFAALRDQLETVRPDVVLIVGDDQNEVFGAAFNPTLAVFCGSEVSGTTSIGSFGDPTQNHVTWKCRADLAQHLAAELTRRGFDPAVMTELRPLSKPERGLGHAFTRVANVVGLNDLGSAIVPVFLNAYHPPLPSAKRCFEMGRAIREIADARPERIAIYASGGLSHDPGGPRAGWIDEPLDNWVLSCISEGRSEELAGLFTFDSAALRGGTGEIRSWIVVAGAFGDSAGEVVDYIPLHHSVTGLAFAHWRPREAPSALAG